MVRCASCGLHYVRPRLKWELILEGYKGGTDANFVSQIAFRETTFRKCLDKIEAISRPSGKRLLDVGAAGGSFLAMARERGYTPLGCEPSTWMCQFAREHYALDLHPGTIFDMPVTPARSTAHAVRRHRAHATRRPSCAGLRALTPSGVLAMSYPTTQLAARLLGSRWPFLLTCIFIFHPGAMTDCCADRIRAPGLHAAPADARARLRRAAGGPYLGPLAGAVTGPLRVLGLRRCPPVLGGPDHGRRAEGHSGGVRGARRRPRRGVPASRPPTTDARVVPRPVVERAPCWAGSAARSRARLHLDHGPQSCIGGARDPRRDPRLLGDRLIGTRRRPHPPARRYLDYPLSLGNLVPLLGPGARRSSPRLRGRGRRRLDGRRAANLRGVHPAALRPRGVRAGVRAPGLEGVGDRSSCRPTSPARGSHPAAPRS